MGTKFSSQSATGFNASPPPDDGSTTASNVVEWSKHVDKLATPIKDLADDINNALVTHFDEGPSPHTTSYTTVAGDYNTVLEVEGSSITITLLAPATAGSGYRLTVKATEASGDVTVQSGSGNIDGQANVTITPGGAQTFIVNDAADEYMTISETEGAATSNTNQVNVKLASAENLTIDRSSSTQVTISLDSIALEDSGGNKRVFGSLSSKIANITTGPGLINGLDTGTEASDTWYYIWVIGTSAGGLESLISASSTSPTLPSGYTFKGLIGSVRNDNSSDFVYFYQRGSHVAQADDQIITSGGATSLTAIGSNVARAVPPIANSVTGYARIRNTNANNLSILNLSAVSPATSTIEIRNSGGNASNDDGGYYEILLHTSQTLYYNVNGANDRTDLFVSGYKY